MVVFYFYVVQQMCVCAMSFSFRATFLYRPKRRVLDAANGARIHLGKAEAFVSEVFQRRAYQIQFLVVNDEEAVVKGFVVADGEARVLRVEGRDVGVRNLAVRHVLFVVMLRGDNRHLHALALLGEQVKRFRRRPVVNQDQ